MEQPFFRSLSTPGAIYDSPEAQAHDAEEARRIAAREEMARDRALGTPRVARPELPNIKAPILPQDFAAKVTVFCRASSAMEGASCRYF
jgi:hypothetical protein